MFTPPFPSSLPPSGAAGGDLGGTYPNPTVLSLANVTNAGLETKLTVDVTDTEAGLFRKNGDTGDVVGIDTTNSRLGVSTNGTIETSYVLAGSTIATAFAVAADATARNGIYVHTNTSTAGGFYNFVRSRGTMAAQTAVVAGDLLGALSVSAHDGTDYTPSSQIRFDADSSPFAVGANQVPGAIEMRTVIEGTSQALVKVFRVNNWGATQFATQTNTVNFTASTEFIAYNFNLNATTQTWATGALTTQRFALFRPHTIAFAGASTVTNAATVTIEGPPVAGTNATITNPYAWWVQAGNSRFDGQMTMSAQIVEDGTTTSTGAGAVALTGSIHEITTNGIGNALTMANGQEGQRISIVYVAEGGGTDTAILTPTSMAGGTTVTFASIGNRADALFTAGKWFFIAQGAVIA